MKSYRKLLGALAGACLLATPALAQDDAKRPPVDVRLNGGIADYTGDLGATTQLGGMYGVTVGTNLPGAMGLLGAEAGYEGSSNSVVGDGTGTVIRHDLNGLLKLGPAFTVRENDQLKPFVGAGIGVSYVNPTDEAEAVGLRTDWLAEVPVAAGVEYRMGNFTAGVRGTYRVLMFDEFAEPTPEANNPSGGLASGSLTLGGVF
ncbi:MAG: outer membrane beta-barrel protein [Myxococcaceae bacterium]